MVKNYVALQELRNYAEENNVPIMTTEGINFLTSYIIKHDIKKILEIGSAIGYSAIMMALANPNAEITTIERDEKRYLEAVKNVKKFNLEDRINLIYNDALDVKINGEFDLIFIDPPYRFEYGKKALEKIAQKGLLSENGIAVYERDRPFEGKIDGLEQYDERKYGKTYLTFFRRERNG